MYLAYSEPTQSSDVETDDWAEETVSHVIELAGIGSAKFINFCLSLESNLRAKVPWQGTNRCAIRAHKWKAFASETCGRTQLQVRYTVPSRLSVGDDYKDYIEPLWLAYGYLVRGEVNSTG